MVPSTHSTIQTAYTLSGLLLAVVRPLGLVLQELLLGLAQVSALSWSVVG
ncbi:MAG: hypothetical protein WAU60_03185 [Candidatus Competibacter denitrificans]